MGQLLPTGIVACAYAIVGVGASRATATVFLLALSARPKAITSKAGTSEAGTRNRRALGRYNDGCSVAPLVRGGVCVWCGTLEPSLLGWWLGWQSLVTAPWLDSGTPQVSMYTTRPGHRYWDNSQRPHHFGSSVDGKQHRGDACVVDVARLRHGSRRPNETGARWVRRPVDGKRADYQEKHYCLLH